MKNGKNSLKDAAVDTLFGVAFIAVVVGAAWLCGRVSGCC